MLAVSALWASTMQVLAGTRMFIPTFGFLMVLGSRHPAAPWPPL